MDQNKQNEIAERLQELWLNRMEELLTSGAATSTDLATLARVFMANGWTLDPKRMPQGLANKLTSNVAFDEDAPEPRIRLAK